MMNMQKIRLGTLLIAAQSGALQALVSAKLTGGTGQERSRFAYRLATIRSAVLRQIDERSDYHAERQRHDAEHISEFLGPDDQPQKEFKHPVLKHRKALEDAVTGLLSNEVEIDMPQVTLDELAAFGVDLTGEQMDLLSFCITEPEDAPLVE